MFKFKKIRYCLLFLFFQGAVNAEQVKTYSGGAPSAAEMGNILFSKPAGQQPQKIKTRSISLTPTSNQQSPSVSTFSLPIKFAYNSAKLLEESKRSINEIGKMMSLSEYSNEKLLIEGHTDAGGSENYNRYLSQKRAESVKKYLKRNYNIASSRLFITGMGESQPLSGTDPYSSTNRRVQFRKAP